MYNTDFPNRADLPSTEKLVRSSILAGIVATALLVTVVLPSEYGIDPTRLGGVLGLTEMGQIKMQLAQEAAANAALSAQVAAGAIVPTQSAVATADAGVVARLDTIEQLLRSMQSPSGQAGTVAPAALPDIASAIAAAPVQQAVVPEVPAATGWRDEVTFTLAPMQGAEFKMAMGAGAIADFEFIVDGGVINFDAHGDGGGQSVTFEEGRAVPGDNGQLQAPFAGNHGWFFRNRGSQDVVVTLRTGGAYVELLRLS